MSAVPTDRPPHDAAHFPLPATLPSRDVAIVMEKRPGWGCTGATHGRQQGASRALGLCTGASGQPQLEGCRQKYRKRYKAIYIEFGIFYFISRSVYFELYRHRYIDIYTVCDILFPGEEEQMHIRTARDLGAAIKHERRKRGFTQAALANEVGVHQPKISAVEKGVPGVRVGLILQILHTLDLELAITAPSPKKPAKDRQAQETDFDLDAIANTGLRR
jgi:HTH-type transcriptional regulator/antitoxin HipB